MHLPVRRLLGGVSFLALGASCAGLYRRAGMLAVAAFVAAVPVQPANAAGLQVTPISLEIAAQEQGQAMFLSNSGKTVLRAQVRVQQWTQTDGNDQLEPTRDVVASPPVVEIAPGGRQMVRIVRLQPAPAAQEKSYRLIIDELPGSEAGSPPSAAGLQFMLRYSVPVFVLPVPAAGSMTSVTSPASATVVSDVSGLSASVKADGQMKAALTITNRGARRIKLSLLTYVDSRGQRTPLYPGLMGYVLAGQAMQWPLGLPVQTLQSGGTLKAKFNDDQEEQTLPLAANRL